VQALVESRAGGVDDGISKSRSRKKKSRAVDVGQVTLGSRCLQKKKKKKGKTEFFFFFFFFFQRHQMHCVKRKRQKTNLFECATKVPMQSRIEISSSDHKIRQSPKCKRKKNAWHAKPRQLHWNSKLPSVVMSTKSPQWKKRQRKLLRRPPRRPLQRLRPRPVSNLSSSSSNSRSNNSSSSNNSSNSNNSHVSLLLRLVRVVCAMPLLRSSLEPRTMLASRRLKAVVLLAVVAVVALPVVWRVAVVPLDAAVLSAAFRAFRRSSPLRQRRPARARRKRLRDSLKSRRAAPLAERWLSRCWPLAGEVKPDSGVGQGRSRWARPAS
jgi:hypothetical protein